ncbi:EamA family transporter RarD [Enhygromyxa salina]|uniref:Putative DMT superfamily transporter inner membrane protein n=1 Tax=Enhygromyxa salina TaxID=215803 RepID=A0A2S9YXQ3_9BACT|nr:EamA family transporter RarD [Enhygromyxa salina]PRQ09868.1 putative DMT superfamily transporter inner membrane protein [Enhygromyxa salina]
MSEPHDRTGYSFALAAYGLWGALPLFWRLLRHVPAGEQLLHRVVWAVVVMSALLLARGRLGELRPVLADPRKRRGLALSAALLGINWFTFLLAVETDRVLHASLGYYLNPIVSVVLGMVVLGERLRRLQWAAVFAAATGVIVLLWQAGEFPWIGLVLASAFGLYGLLRKTIEVEPLPGSTIEAGMLAIPGVVVIAWLGFDGSGHFAGPDLRTTALLLAAGPITAVPLLWFTNAARRLPLYALGFMQYITPTSHFLLAVLVFDEVFTGAHALAFAAIWAGVALFALDLMLQRRRQLPARP